MAKRKQQKMYQKPPYFAGILAWLVPGAGHWYLGMYARGLVIFFSVCVTFALGILLGGIEMIDPLNDKWWFAAQILAGIPAIVIAIFQDPNVLSGVGRGVDHGQVYTGVVGLLNLLCIMDALGRSQKSEPSGQSETKKRTEII